MPNLGWINIHLWTQFLFCSNMIALPKQHENKRIICYFHRPSGKWSQVRITHSLYKESVQFPGRKLVGGGVHICCVIIEIQKISLFFIPWTAVVKLDSFNEMNYSKTTFSNTAHCPSTSRSLHPPPHLIPPNLLCLILFTPSSQYRCCFFTRSSLMPWLWTLAKNEFYIFK